MIDISSKSIAVPVCKNPLRARAQVLVWFGMEGGQKIGGNRTQMERIVLVAKCL